MTLALRYSIKPDDNSHVQTGPSSRRKLIPAALNILYKFDLHHPTRTNLSQHDLPTTKSYSA